MIISFEAISSPLAKALDDLKTNITREIKNIKTSVLESVFLNLKKRCNLLIEKNGGHIEEK